MSQLTVEELIAEFVESVEKSITESGIDLATERGIAIRNWVLGCEGMPSELPDDDVEVARDKIRRSIERRNANRQKRVVDDGQREKPTA